MTLTKEELVKLAKKGLLCFPLKRKQKDFVVTMLCVSVLVPTEFKNTKSVLRLRISIVK